eukprot:CAMPEP_0185417330 /NCGR_PEP_ID=MMETSP1365-20130426/7910_1 /TAXON_ID=38817 /ORGANISM="Gephyrocapsa oceanica, Strain RCC1303" /LENGTH=121 /DNA_ID=CAMNT_0028020637 /DNA_START=240 /DNA_END=605 /DNA_ORIENTATION=+
MSTTLPGHVPQVEVDWQGDATLAGAGGGPLSRVSAARLRVVLGRKRRALGRGGGEAREVRPRGALGAAAQLDHLHRRQAVDPDEPLVEQRRRGGNLLAVQHPAAVGRAGERVRRARPRVRA